ncbi:UNVERIFIED_CONTAM: hypothetical protein Slati_4608500 [Sesamum latifolium]|uniref:Uncharacterized protein n=1 Tax=Sesamum latifolium TaxID=2727402 RepID=A0AAW2RPS5_9LAMI
MGVTRRGVFWGRAGARGPHFPPPLAARAAAARWGRGGGRRGGVAGARAARKQAARGRPNALLSVGPRGALPHTQRQTTHTPTPNAQNTQTLGE